MNILGSILASGLSISMLCMPSAAHALEIKCPADVYSPDYQAYLDRLRNLLNFTIEPKIYGTEAKIHRLQKKFSDLSFNSRKSVSFVFADSHLQSLYKADCEDCSMAAYEKLAASCAVALERRCVDFAVVIDGKAQCMLTPKPEL